LRLAAAVRRKREGRPLRPPRPRSGNSSWRTGRASELPREVHAELFALAPDATVAIDLASQTLTLPGGRAVEFPIDPFARHCLLNGIDELGYIRQQEDAIAAFEARRQSAVNTLG